MRIRTMTLYLSALDCAIILVPTAQSPLPPFTQGGHALRNRNPVPFNPPPNYILACKNVTGRCPGVPEDIHARCAIVRGHCPPNYNLYGCRVMQYGFVFQRKPSVLRGTTAWFPLGKIKLSGRIAKVFLIFLLTFSEKCV